MTPKFDWTPERIEFVRTSIEEGRSMTDIGKELGCSRSCVAGIIHRQRYNHGVEIKAPAKPPKEQGTSKRVPKPLREKLSTELIKFVRVKPPPPPDLSDPRVAYQHMRHDQCRWLEGDVLPYRPCQNTAKWGTSWCPEHHKRVYTPARQRHE